MATRLFQPVNRVVQTDARLRRAISAFASPSRTGRFYPTGYGDLLLNQYNIGLGINVLTKSYGTQYNVGIGFEVLTNNTTGSYNVGVGYQTLKANTTGDYNVGVGYLALTALTTGDDNVAFGYKALTAVTTGTSNVAVGASAGRDLQGSASGSTLVGRAAGLTATTGTFNTFVGYNSGASVTTGANNTSIGAYTGPYTAGQSLCVFIGEFAGFGNSRNETLEIRNRLLSDPLIYGEFDTPMVRIYGDLDVTGDFTVAGTITAPGSDTHVVFNDGGDLGADSDLTWDKTGNKLTVTGSQSVLGEYLQVKQGTVLYFD